MIDPNHFSLNKDGTAWLVDQNHTFKALDRSCDCEVACPRCRWTGRYIFPIHISRGKRAAILAMAVGRPTYRTYRVHVSPGMVYPIVGADYDTGPGNYVVLTDYARLIADDTVYPIDQFPSGAEVGMFAVKLVVHS